VASLGVFPAVTAKPASAGIDHEERRLSFAATDLTEALFSRALARIGYGDSKAKTMLSRKVRITGVIGRLYMK